MSMKAPGILALVLIAWGSQAFCLENPTGMRRGTPELKAAGPLAFSPEGILFTADSEGATILAIDLSEDEGGRRVKPILIPKIDEMIAAMLGTAPEEILIQDLAVNPVSGNVFFSVSRGRGDEAVPVLIRATKKGVVSEVSLKDVLYSEATIKNAPDPEARTRWGASLRADTITDLVFADGELFVAGLSNEEFSSMFRRLKFPFDDEAEVTSLEIYHVAHGAYETNAPIRTFAAFQMNNEPHIIAAYTCTPLVAFPMEKMADGAHVKGSTIAELGSGNRPLDIITYGRSGRSNVLIANNNRTLMKLETGEIAATKALTEPLDPENPTLVAGARYRALPMVGVLQIDNLNAQLVVMLQRDVATGDLNLTSVSKSRL